MKCTVLESVDIQLGDGGEIEGATLSKEDAERLAAAWGEDGVPIRVEIRGISLHGEVNDDGE